MTELARQRPVPHRNDRRGQGPLRQPEGQGQPGSHTGKLCIALLSWLP